MVLKQAPFFQPKQEISYIPKRKVVDHAKLIQMVQDGAEQADIMVWHSKSSKPPVI